MKDDEKRALRTAVDTLHAARKQTPFLKAFFATLDDLKLPSIRKASFEEDMAYFRELSTLLSFIETIAHKPRFIVVTNDTIMRADQAGSLSNESFFKTVHDPSLWKQKKQGGLSPEYVHHTVSEDDIRTYENRFVIMVLHSVERDLASYKEFYAYSLRSIFSKGLTQDNDAADLAFKEIAALSHKIGRIKRTDFYRLVAPSAASFHFTAATNVLKCDRLYNWVYRFYRQHGVFAEDSQVEVGLTRYYMYLILKFLKKDGFEVREPNGALRVYGRYSVFNSPKPATFSNADFDVAIICRKEGGFIVEVSPKGSSLKARHLLYVNPSYSFSSYPLKASREKGFDSIEALSIWTLSQVEGLSVPIENKAKSDQALMDSYFDDKLVLAKGSKRIYDDYCPACRDKTVYHSGDVSVCSHCSSKYGFTKDGGLFFLRLRGGKVQ